MRYVCKNPPGGGGGERNPYQLIDYQYIALYYLVNIHHFKANSPSLSNVYM